MGGGECDICAVGVGVGVVVVVVGVERWEHGRLALNIRVGLKQHRYRC